MLLKICVLLRTYCRALGNPTLPLAILSRYLKIFVITLISKPVCVYMSTHVSVGACQFMYVGVSEKKSQVLTSGMLSTPFGKGSLSGLELTKGRLGWLLSSRDLPVSVSPALGVRFSKLLNSRGSSRVFISKFKQSLCRR